MLPKRELIWLCAAWYMKLCPVDAQLIAGALFTPSLKVRDLGVMIDSDLSLKSHARHVASVGCFHIRQLRPIRRSLTFETAHSLARAMVHSRLDYCNGILANASLGLVNSLQSVLRSAARLVLRLPPWASLTKTMRAAPLVAGAAADHFQALHYGIQMHSRFCSYQPVSDVVQCSDGSSTCGTPVCRIWTSIPTWHSNVCCGPAWFLLSCCLEHSSTSPHC